MVKLRPDKFLFYVLLVAILMIAMTTLLNNITLSTKAMLTVGVLDEAPIARNLNGFKALQEKIMRGRMEAKVSFNSLSFNGYGNRVYTFLTAFVIAILDDRALVFTNWSIIGFFVKEPAHAAFRDFANKTSLFNVDYRSDEVATIPTWPSAFTNDKDLDRVVETTVSSSNVSRVRLLRVDSQFFALCSNPIYYEKLYNYGLVKRATIDSAYAMADKSKSKDASKDERLERVLHVGFEVAGNLLNKHWRMRRIIRKRVEHYMDNFFKGHFVIGLQLRKAYLTVEFEHAYKAFIRCAQWIETNHTALVASRPVRWFVTTDSKKLYDMIFAEYGERMIQVNGTIGHTYDDYGRDAIGVYTKTLVENELLSRCDEIVITGGSTFGFVAAMKMLRLPYYLNYNMDKCVRANLSRPPACGSFVTF